MAKNASKTNDASGKRGRGQPSPYDADLHPAALVEHFARVWRRIEDVEKSQSRDGIKYTLRPELPPTLGGFAASIGVSRETLWRWSTEHEEFLDAVNRAKAIAEDLYVKMAALGCYPAHFATFLLKNAVSGWSDRADVNVTGSGLTLRFDAQDEAT